MRTAMVAAVLAVVGIGMACYLTGCVNAKAPDNIIVGVGVGGGGVPTTLDDELATLRQWRRDGILSDQEYERIKARLVEADKRKAKDDRKRSHDD